MSMFTFHVFLLLLLKSSFPFCSFRVRQTVPLLKSVIDPLEEAKVSNSAVPQKSPLKRNVVNLPPLYDSNITESNNVNFAKNDSFIYNIKSGNNSVQININASTLPLVIYSEFKAVCYQIIPR